MESVELNLDIRAAIDFMNLYQRSFFHLIWLGYTNREIMKYFHISKREVCDIRKEIRDILLSLRLVE